MQPDRPTAAKFISPARKRRETFFKILKPLSRGDNTSPLRAQAFTRTALSAMFNWIFRLYTTRSSHLNETSHPKVPSALRPVSFTTPTLFAITGHVDYKARLLTHPTPIPAYDDQDARFAHAFRILEDAIVARAFPAASVAVTHRNQLMALRTFGRFTYDPASPEPTTATLFDLASLTKVIATTSMAMVLYERGLLDLDVALISIVGEFSGEDPRRDEVTLRMLLAHSSGLPAYEKLFLRARTRDELLALALAMPLANDPGSHAEYSDIGFILLGVALERLADESLARFCQREIFGPLALTHTTFKPAPELRSKIPATADDQTFRHRIIQGEVQDENASVLGGVAAHAGLFANGQDVATFANAMLRAGTRSSDGTDEHGATGVLARRHTATEPTADRPEKLVFRPETVALFTTRESSPEGTSRALGWDTPSSPSQSGRYFSPRSYGHLGYTGTSLWIDPERDISITLLTNRTWPDCANQAIKQIRPRFHDAVFEVLGLADVATE
jgi:serine-type D-Ala-D-Ala carboxypeptidase